MTKPTLADAVLEAMAFLALSSDDIVDPDAAVGLLERLTEMLRDLLPQERYAFDSRLQVHLNEAKSEGSDRAKIDFLESVARDIVGE